MINLEVERSQYNMKIVITHSNMKDRIEKIDKRIQCNMKEDGKNTIQKEHSPIGKRVERTQSNRKDEERTQSDIKEDGKDAINYQRRWKEHSRIGKKSKGHNQM